MRAEILRVEPAHAPPVALQRAAPGPRALASRRGSGSSTRTTRPRWASPAHAWTAWPSTRAAADRRRRSHGQGRRRAGRALPVPARAARRLRRAGGVGRPLGPGPRPNCPNWRRSNWRSPASAATTPTSCADCTAWLDARQARTAAGHRRFPVPAGPGAVAPGRTAARARGRRGRLRAVPRAGAQLRGRPRGQSAGHRGLPRIPLRRRRDLVAARPRTPRRPGHDQEHGRQPPEPGHRRLQARPLPARRGRTAGRGAPAQPGRRAASACAGPGWPWATCCACAAQRRGARAAARGVPRRPANWPCPAKRRWPWNTSATCSATRGGSTGPCATTTAR